MKAGKEKIIIAVILALASVVLVRWQFREATGQTLEDAMITFRYAENIADGNGFVYNASEHVLGTTSPLWTMILAAARASCSWEVMNAAACLGIIFDAATLMIIFCFLYEEDIHSPLAFAVLFAFSPWIVSLSVSGMETSLVLFGMALTLWGFRKSTDLFGVGIALVFLTRIDGLLFGAVMMAWAVIRNPGWSRREAVVAMVLCIPWIVYAQATFGSVLPESFLAKRAVYRFSAEVSAAPVLRLLSPIGETRPFIAVLKSLWSLILVSSLFFVFRNRPLLRPLIVFVVLYATVLMVSGMLIFSWYLIPLIFSLTVALAATAGSVRNRWHSRSPRQAAAGFWVTIIACGIAGMWLLVKYGDRDKAVQAYEETVRKPIGLWLAANTPPGTSILLEPIGYVGYFAGRDRRILDEIGIVTPAIVPIRRRGKGWYLDALKVFHPDYVVQYDYALQRNVSEGTGDPLFADVEEERWFHDHYRPVARFKLEKDIPWMQEKEKRFTILKRADP
jgi:hypothetical protein